MKSCLKIVYWVLSRGQSSIIQHESRGEAKVLLVFNQLTFQGLSMLSSLPIQFPKELQLPYSLSYL
jgi:hypothetical protein